MSSGKSVASVVGGKTARACDSCITKRARWYCAADDAFLCQACDSSVHSANPLARRHERVRLKTASYAASEEHNSAPTWHHGFTKKARTPRHAKHQHQHQHQHQQQTVPEEGSDEVNSHEENEEQLLYRVPVFDPFVGEAGKACSSLGYHAGGGGFLPSDVELAEFAADVESLLGSGMGNECVGMEELGLMDNHCKEDEEEEYSWDYCSVGSGKKVVKVELEGESGEAVDDQGREPFELSFDYDDEESRETCDDHQVKEKVERSGGEMKGVNDEEEAAKRRKILLQLDYEGVITAWASSKKSPWTTGDRPTFDLDDCWPHFLGSSVTQLHHPYGELVGYGCHPVMGDGGREARVSRYREKRRTRLFSKKIRYEVRKLNAEKRPRMKGRFVKRASFAAPPPAFPLLNK